RVIDAGAPATREQPTALFLGLLTRRRIHDGRASPGAWRREGLLERTVHAAVSVAAARDVGRPQRKVGPGEAADDLRSVGPEAEPRQDLVAHDRGSGGGAREHPRAGKLGKDAADLEIL